MEPVRKYNPQQKYITVWELALDLKLQPATVGRWVRKWTEADKMVGVGKRPGTGYKLPYGYLMVGRGWAQTEDKDVRDVLLKVLPDDPKNYVVVVGKSGYTCYSVDEAVELVATALSVMEDGEVAEPHERSAHVFYVGPTNNTTT